MAKHAKPDRAEPGRPRQHEDESSYESNLRRNREARRRDTKAGQDIGPIPPVRNWERRLACRDNLELFLRTYLHRQFYLDFCDDHRKVIRKADVAVIQGGLFAVAMPRGSGKTEITKGAALKAVLYGQRRFVLLIGATGPAAHDELLGGLKSCLDSPELFPELLEDFPEVVFPIVALDGSIRKQGGQHSGGTPTQLDFSTGVVDLPIVPPGNWIDGKTLGPAPSAGAKIRATSITGRVRGFNLGGLRPDLVVADDPQTDESARSPSGNEKVERILGRAVIGLAGPDKTIAGLMPCTVIEPGDAIDRILNHDLHPEWDSERTKMLYAFPSLIVERNGRRVDVAKEHWERYREIKHSYNPNLGEGEKLRAQTQATEYYIEHHEEMSAGAVVAWPQRCGKDQVDGLQRAMDFWLQDKAAFAAEAQNDPLPVQLGDQVELTALEIAGRLSKSPRHVPPVGAAKLTAFVDVQQRLLYYAVCAWADDFTGWVLDYGSYPDQGRGYFTLSDASRTLDRLPGLEAKGIEAQIYGGLGALCKDILGKTWKGGGVDHAIQRCLIDSGFQTKVIYSFCRSSDYKNILTPSKGSGVGPAAKSLTDHDRQPNEKQGLEWYALPAKESRGLRLLHYDSNFWKSFIMARLAIPPGGRGNLTLFGEDLHAHRMFSEQDARCEPSRADAGGLLGARDRAAEGELACQQMSNLPSRRDWSAIAAAALICASCARNRTRKA